MWLSKQAARQARQTQTVDVGVVSIAGSAPAVITDGETRDLAVFGPGGYAWRPSAGDQVLVLKAGATDAVAGAKLPQAALLPGEIQISTGAAAIRLLPDGTIALTGSVTVNGQPITGGTDE